MFGAGVAAAEAGGAVVGREVMCRDELASETRRDETSARSSLSCLLAAMRGARGWAMAESDYKIAAVE